MAKLHEFWPHLHRVDPTNLGLGTLDAAALTVRIVRGWANDMAVASKEVKDADGVLPIGTCLETARTACPQFAAICAAQWEPFDRKFWQRCDDGWTLDGTTRGGWQGSRAMQVMILLGLEFALSKSNDLAPREITRIGLQDDMTFVGSAAARNRSWSTIEGVLADAGHRLRSYKCGVGAPGFEQFEDAELPMEVRNLSLKVSRKRHGVSFLGSAANAQHCMPVGLGQPAEVPTQTIERVEKALALQSIERFACDQHDHVSFAKVWMLMSKGVAHALDYDFRLVPPAVMAPVRRRLEGGLRQTLSVLLGSDVSELAWERAKLATRFGGLGIRVAQMGFAAQATYWSAVDLHKAVMTNQCEALNRPIREPHPEVAGALAAKTDLLSSGVAVDEHARVTIETRGRRASELQRSFARLLCRQLIESRRRVWLGAWRSPSCNRGFCRLRVKCSQNSRPSCSVRETWYWHVLDGHAQITDGTGTKCAMEDGHGPTAWCHDGCWPTLYVCPEEGQRWGHVRAVSGPRIRSTLPTKGSTVS